MTKEEKKLYTIISLIIMIVLAYAVITTINRIDINVWSNIKATIKENSNKEEEKDNDEEIKIYQETIKNTGMQYNTAYVKWDRNYTGIYIFTEKNVYYAMGINGSTEPNFNDKYTAKYNDDSVTIFYGRERMKMEFRNNGGQLYCELPAGSALEAYANKNREIHGIYRNIYYVCEYNKDKWLKIDDNNEIILVDNGVVKQKGILIIEDNGFVLSSLNRVGNYTISSSLDGKTIYVDRTAYVLTDTILENAGNI